ncbi:hypothetical protein L208DRAFT_1178375, partial [Tricholoma matsutake]
SCAYDAILAILFNTWHQDPAYYTTIWQQIVNTELNMLVTGFDQLINNPQVSLETIRETMRHHFASLSDSAFHYGHYTSVPSIFLTLLQRETAVTKTTRGCMISNHAVFHETTVINAMIKVCSAEPSQSLQSIMNHFQEPLPSRSWTCNQCQLRLTTIVSHQPLLAFEWGINAPTLINTLHIAAGDIYHTYHLCGIIYLVHGHFTSHFLDHEGQWWFYDGI